VSRSFVLGMKLNRNENIILKYIYIRPLNKLLEDDITCNVYGKEEDEFEDEVKSINEQVDRKKGI